MARWCGSSKAVRGQSVETRQFPAPTLGQGLDYYGWKTMLGSGGLGVSFGL